MTEETSTSQVPLLDLAPKLKRPLSLWNPLDYLLLLYWVFYFPQAIRWYTETFCEPPHKSKSLTWRQRWQLFKNSHFKRQLIIMCFLLTISTPIVIGGCLDIIGLQINWYKMAIGLLTGIVFGGLVGVFLAFKIAGVLTFSLIVSVVNAFSSTFRLASILIGGLLGIGIGEGITGDFSRILLGMIAGGITSGVVTGFVDSLTVGMADNLSVTIVVITILVIIFRPDDWVLSIWRIPRITTLKFSRLTRQLNIWLENDWRKGIINAKQLLQYSRQFIPIQIAINEKLAVTPSNLLIERIAILSNLIEDWDILIYISGSLNELLLKLKFSEGVFWFFYRTFFFNRWNANQNQGFTTYCSVIKGFWYLDKSANEKDMIGTNLWRSETIFEELKHIKNGEEMHMITRILGDFNDARSIPKLLKLKPSILTTSQLLRPTTWSAIKKLILVLENIRLVDSVSSPTVRSFSLNRALGFITEIQDELLLLPPEDARIERPIIQNITIIWRDILLAVAAEIGQVEIKRPIANPYTIGDPVMGERFIGREDLLGQLKELWFINSSPQSVILYGHRRMGKTSILRNATTKVNSQVSVAYVNLLSIGSAPNGITDILMAICDAIQEVTDITAPSNNDLFQFPETAFRRYLQHVEKDFTGTGLIIALDEFEKIEELIDAGKLSKDFLGFLRGMVQMSSKLAFAFAGLHTLQEMNADYFQPFYASFIPISVAFLTREATHQVLANPDPEFLLEYEPAALDYIYDLTNGQPYLTQLIGFQLVRLFNDYVFEQGKPRDRTFTIGDVHTVCSGENFFNTGINYFNGVWQQAAEGATNQHEILKALAPHPQGLTESELISQTNLPSESLQSALKTLKDHDVIHNLNNGETQFAIAVELFRTWVVKYKLRD
ncbi:ATP-binding protein [Pseudanabaena sp. lw0831]|uniref:AAA family ATPase n=1 Tax=Pseudanabaena sp. lw0831 TaxID=1357935 RepID=UPI0019155CDF|nr:orc1/cdc6 family replication initiation protein [Pseudanabaena sp. lw0831]